MNRSFLLYKTIIEWFKRAKEELKLFWQTLKEEHYKRFPEVKVEKQEKKPFYKILAEIIILFELMLYTIFVICIGGAIIYGVYVICKEINNPFVMFVGEVLAIMVAIVVIYEIIRRWAGGESEFWRTLCGTILVIAFILLLAVPFVIKLAWDFMEYTLKLLLNINVQTLSLNEKLMLLQTISNITLTSTLIFFTVLYSKKQFSTDLSKSSPDKQNKQI